MKVNNAFMKGNMKALSLYHNTQTIIDKMDASEEVVNKGDTSACKASTDCK